jgi:hypothetical protein
MQHLLHRTGTALLLGLITHLAAAQVAPTALVKTPMQRCEAAVTESIQKTRGADAQQVQWSNPKRNATAPDPSSIKGQGRYDGAAGSISFTYICTLNPETGELAGVMFSDIRQPVLTSTPSAEKPWQADLSRLSPEACETAAAAALKQKVPHVGGIVFSSSARQLTPAPKGHTYLHGTGTLERVPGMTPSPFNYRCELETGTGKFLNVQTELSK